MTDSFVMDNVFPKYTIFPLVVSVALLNWYFLVVAHDYTFFYYLLWLGVFGFLFVKYRERIILRLQKWKASSMFKFMALGYGAVLLEELIVGFVHAANEGFTATVFFMRVEQFWAFNIFAFTGFIMGWYVALKRFSYRPIDVFLVTGFWGLFSEHTIVYLLQSSSMALLLIFPTISTYNLIIAPAVASITQGEVKKAGLVKRYIFALSLFFMLSVVPMTLLAYLRAYFPAAFPPCEYIPCVRW